MIFHIILIRFFNFAAIIMSEFPDSTNCVGMISFKEQFSLNSIIKSFLQLLKERNSKERRDGGTKKLSIEVSKNAYFIIALSCELAGITTFFNFLHELNEEIPIFLTEKGIRTNSIEE